MIAFVLSGAGNRGPLEVGALRALVERNLRPEFLVGTSAGAINALFVAANGLSLSSLDRLADLWRDVTDDVVYPGNILSVAWRVLRGNNSLFESRNVREVLQGYLPPGLNTFDQLQLPLYVSAVDLVSSRLFVFGEDGRAPLLDAVVGSASVPIVHPPVEYHGLQLVDGGVLANVAASLAMDKGATEIYMINAGYGGGRMDPPEGIVSIASRTLHTMMAQTLFRDLERARTDKNIDLHHLHLTAYGDVPFRDFSRCDEMIAAGYEAAQQYFSAPAPALVAPASPEKPELGATVPGAREFLLPYNR